MTSLSKNSFTVNFVDNLGKSSGYSILKTLMEIPFWALFIGGLWGLLKLSMASVEMQILAPLFMFIFVVFCTATKTTILNGWAPSIVAFRKCAGSAFKKGLKSVARNYTSTLSSFSVVMIFMVALILIFGPYAFILVLPLMALINAVFGQVLFFESQGMNYYITPENIIKPRKLEQADNMKKVKFII